MPRAPKVPASLRGRVFRASREIARGNITRHQLASSAWRRLFHDVYADATVEITYQLRCVAALRLLLPRGSVLAGRSAAAFLNIDLTNVDDPVEVIVPLEERTRLRHGFLVHTGHLSPHEIVNRSGVAITAAPRTAWDLTQWLTPVEAVVWIDRLLAAGALTLPELTQEIECRRHTSGVSKLIRATDLVDARSESPQESRLRVGMVQAGLPRPVSQHEIRVGGQFVARVDFAWPKYKVAVEYDGAWHGAPSQLHRDRKRLNRLVEAGWIVLHVTSVRLREDLPGVVGEIRSTLLKRAAVS